MVKKAPKRYIFKISRFSPSRIHIEIPAKDKDDFELGEQVEVKKLN